MHWQAPPMVSASWFAACVACGMQSSTCAGSETYGRWWSVELSETDGTMLYVPEGVAHGFLTLVPDTEVLYLVTDPYVAEAARGVRWDDPAFGIEWPSAPVVMSERDRAYPDHRP